MGFDAGIGEAIRPDEMRFGPSADLGTKLISVETRRLAAETEISFREPCEIDMWRTRPVCGVPRSLDSVDQRIPISRQTWFVDPINQVAGVRYRESGLGTVPEMSSCAVRMLRHGGKTSA